MAAAAESTYSLCRVVAGASCLNDQLHYSKHSGFQIPAQVKHSHLWSLAAKHGSECFVQSKKLYIKKGMLIISIVYVGVNSAWWVVELKFSKLEDAWIQKAICFPSFCSFHFQLDKDLSRQHQLTLITSLSLQLDLTKLSQRFKNRSALVSGRKFHVWDLAELSF